MARATVTFDSAVWNMDRDGIWLSIHTKDRQSVVRICEECKTAHIAEIKPITKKRSLDSNSYMWLLLDKLSSAVHIPKSELYKRLIKDVGGVSETVCVKNNAVDRLCSGWEHNGLGWVTDTIPSKIDGCTNVILYYGSSTYDSVQMARLIDIIVQECKQQGIDVVAQSELA